MGCLNADRGFTHWFGNIHLSGPCNRSCYFCIGQHMMALDPLNNLSEFPLKGFDEFIARCRERGVREVNVTGTNTDPLLYEYTFALHGALKQAIPDLVFGLRTNGVLLLDRLGAASLYDKGSLTICSFDPAIYRKMMGQGEVPDVKRIMSLLPWRDKLKLNVVLGPENVARHDVLNTLTIALGLGIKRVNLREPYGQPHVGNPLFSMKVKKHVLGMPCFDWYGMEVVYWDVHYVEVESVNLYASGRVSETYPITRGHADDGRVVPQSFFPGGRVAEQWKKMRVTKNEFTPR
jgi:hypothetical protein